MERQQCNPLQNFDDSKSEILKKRLLKSSSAPACNNLAATGSQHNVLLNTLRTPISSSMIVSSVGSGQGSLPLQHGLVTHSLAPVKLHPNPAPYPLQLSTVHVPVQIPGTSANINVPVQLSGPSSSVPLQIAPVSLPIQVSGTTSVPVQLPAGDTINVPLQIPGASQNIQLGAPGMQSMPILQSSSQPMSSIIHVHMGSNPRSNSMDNGSDMTVTSSSQLQTVTSGAQVQMGNNSTVVQIPSSVNNSIQLALPNSVSSGTVQLRGATRNVPHVVYIQTPQGLKPVTSTDVISQASTSGNPPQIIVRRPVTSNSNIHLISNVNNKPNIAPKIAQGKTVLAPAATPPIVIQKPKSNEKMIVPVSIAPGNTGKQAIAYLSSVKKPNTKNMADNQSILISNNQTTVNSNNQKLFLTPMNMPKIQNTKFILPVTLPASMASKGPIINLQIANGQIQNDPQGNITVMRDSSSLESADMPPLQPLAKMGNVNGNSKEANLVPQSPNKCETYTISIPGSRAEPTEEQGTYTLSIPETNASMNDDIYTVSIADDEDQSREKSFTLAIPEKGKSLLNRNMIERNEVGSHVTIAAPAILRRSNSDNSERKATNANLKRRISLCNENLSSKTMKLTQSLPKPAEKSEEPQDSDNNDDHRVPSLFCDEKLDKDLECKVILGDSDEEYKEKKEPETTSLLYYQKDMKNDRMKRESVDSALEEDPPGLYWNNGIAQLQGSTLQFQTNEFGLIDLIDASDPEELPLPPSAKYHTPLKQRLERPREKKPTSPEDLYRCDGCGCHGMAAEFITPNFCSLTCQSDVQKVTQKKRDRERAELTRRRNKMKKLLMRKQHDEPMDEPAKPDDEKLSDDVIDEKYPWMCGKNGFSWMRYLDFCKAKAAPVKLFKDPFPYNRNGFKVGMRMEAIDPQRASVWAVVSVAEVQGYRLRLHFDSYPDIHDYWVNADCPDIFPAGWCERNQRALRPPAAHAHGFSWPMYLKQMRAIAAPRHLFPHITTTTVKPNGFRIGMKLEAEDRKNDMVCVATVADMLDARLLINFDSWDDMYDVWLDPTSPYIHPVGWAEENDIALTPPNFYKDPESFSWDSYLADTGAAAAPPRAFKTRAPHGFKPGMKLEVVDKRVPFLIRVASVSEVKDHQVRVAFDGWPDELSYWLDDDSPDIHPVGWCLKTGHPLEPPLTAEEAVVLGPCGVGGCRGLGSLRGGAHKQHVAASACPYRAPASPAPPDRLAAERPMSAPRPCGGAAAGLGSLRGGAHKQHVAASACPYRAPASPAPPDRLAAERPMSAPRPCGGAAAGLGSLRGGAHKQHVAASACPYRAPASPAPPDRLAAERPMSAPRPCGGAAAGLGSLRGGAHKQHVAASACPYRAPASPAPPDRLAAERPMSAPRPCGGAAAGLGSLRGGAHKQHVAASACPYRAPASPAPPDRLAAERPMSAPRPCGGAAAGLGSLRGGAHKQHVAASACPYRAPASPAPPDRLAAERPMSAPRPCGGAAAGLGSLRGGAHKQHVAASACPYRAPASPAPPDRLAAERPMSAPRPCGGAAAGLGSLRGGAHKQHVAASACPYRAPASPAPPDRLAAERPMSAPRPCGGAAAGLGSLRGGAHKQHVAASACPYRAPASPAPPDRLAAERPMSAPRPCGGAAAGLGSLRGGAHKQHVAASACPYRAPASPAPPDRLAAERPMSAPRPCGGAAAGLGSLRGGAHKQHVAASACPYRAPASPAPPDRLAAERPMSAPRPCGGAAAGLGSLRGGAHKQHVAASACPYRAPASPAPPDRLAAERPMSAPRPCGGAAAGLGSLRGGAHKQHVAASACPYRAPASPAPPDRLAAERPMSAPRPCGGAAAGLGSLRGGAHKQHVAASACPYRAPASPAPPDRLAAERPMSAPRPCGGAAAGLGSLRGGAHKQHVAASACPYRAPASPAPPDRLAAERPMRPLGRPPKTAETLTPTSDTHTPKEKPTRGRPPKHKRVEEVSKADPGSDEESISSSNGGSGSRRWRARRPREPRAARALRPDVRRHIAALQLPSRPDIWTQEEVGMLVALVGGAAAGAAARAARLAGRELLMASCEELVACLHIRLGPAVKVMYCLPTQLQEEVGMLVARPGGGGHAGGAARLAGRELLMASCEELVACLHIRLGPAVKVMYCLPTQLQEEVGMLVARPGWRAGSCSWRPARSSWPACTYGWGRLSRRRWACWWRGQAGGQGAAHGVLRGARGLPAHTAGAGCQGNVLSSYTTPGGGGHAGGAARLAGRELLMASCEELVACLHIRLGPAVKVMYCLPTQLQEEVGMLVARPGWRAGSCSWRPARSSWPACTYGWGRLSR
ncbi:uncharacterized protein LOC133520979 [Cydia pomonella]|uniref:uncharacterized protein LOC133520979 n=1 Tax=Cydia pomonella TaxID=82600 RepID=UPI002ADDF12C|nr:uncharacterized protein LOC133520979 [Cydia pomonella]